MIRNKLENILRSIFSVFIMIAIAGGAVIFVLFIAAIIIGGAAGEALAVNISKIYLPYFIRSASIAVISGLVMFYVGNCHTLSLKVEKKTEATE